MSGTTLGTFRVDKGDWDKFKSLCSEAGSSASAEIVAFIRHCNEQESVGDRLPGKSDLEQLIKDIDNRIEAAMFPLLDRIEKLETAQTAKNEAVPENSPLRMASSERNGSVRTNHPNGTQEAVAGAEKGELLSNAEFVKAAAGLGVRVTRNHATNWKKAGNFSAKPEGREAAKYFDVVKGRGFRLKAKGG